MGEMEWRTRIHARVNSKGFKDLSHNMMVKDKVFLLNQFSSFQFCENSCQRRN